MCKNYNLEVRTETLTVIISNPRGQQRRTADSEQILETDGNFGLIAQISWNLYRDVSMRISLARLVGALNCPFTLILGG